jgi:periplasmic divalent cation tolerance protein
MPEFIQVMTTVDSREVAERIARILLEQRLAACVQIAGPIASRYWWQGEVAGSEEWLCLAKTERRLYGTVEQAILAGHPYDTPEVLAIPVSDGSAKYLDWLFAQLQRA